MPPKAAPKEKVIKGDEAEEVVLQYLKSVNRPFASTDVSANLKGKVSKTAAQKILLTLAERGALTQKTYGKQTIFVYNQELFAPFDAVPQLSVLPPQEMAAIDKELKETQAGLEERRKELRGLQAELAAREALPKTKELGREIERVKGENDMTLKALVPFRGSADAKATIAPMSVEDTKKIDDEFVKWRKEWIARRKVYKEFMALLQDSGQVGADKTAFEEDQDIRDDDDEAKEVESGEFCKPAGGISARPRQVQKMASVPAPKRSASNASQDEGKKKKAKKA